MKKGMKAIVAVSVVLLILSLSSLAAATTANQNVVLSITPAYTGVAAIRVFDGATANPTVTFTDTYQGTYSVQDAGSEATKSVYAGYTSLTEKSGGSLQYTVAGYTDDYKITVHSGTANYQTESLYVLVGGLQDNTGAAVPSLGTVVTNNETTDNNPTATNLFLIPQGSIFAKDIITAIPGDNTYTGTAAAYDTNEDYWVPGAPIIYGFNDSPGVNTIAVTYTITADPS